MPSNLFTAVLSDISSRPVTCPFCHQHSARVLSVHVVGYNAITYMMYKAKRALCVSAAACSSCRSAGSEVLSRALHAHVEQACCPRYYRQGL